MRSYDDIDNSRINYVILLLILSVSLILKNSHAWCIGFLPDIPLLIIIFLSIFHGIIPALYAGLLVGIINGVLSLYFLNVNVAIYPIVACITAFLAEILYKQQAFVQAALTLLALLIIYLCQSIYLDFHLNNKFNIWIIFSANWRVIITTVFFAPYFFQFLNDVQNRD
ncbi:membrane protein [Candidatus Omnitrophus magneticus]|uniref:Membrane protein n=1 Tax=Candidatus Omnitrophus magneticus TaxID=1609969 RepID=A0A0F0CV74_9BACT|nr:membrane protein [Candidatus Omnitrophus magneticus]